MMAAVAAAMTLGELLGPIAGDLGPVSVTDLVSDSREVTPGAAFIAIPGARNHGLEFAAEALAAGACAVIYEPSVSLADVPAPALAVPGLQDRIGELGRRFYGRDSTGRGLIGITGTNGKTTVAWLIAQALSALGKPCGYVGTLGYGEPGKLKPQTLTTPDCLSLHRELAEIGLERSALEVSSHAIAQDRIAGLEFEIAAFTNLSRDHLDWHGTLEAYFSTKARLFERAELKAAVVNGNDAYADALLARLGPTTRAVTVAVDSDRPADIEARAEIHGLRGVSLEVRDANGSFMIESPLIGAFNAENLLVALGVLVAAGEALDRAGAALSQATPPPGRMETLGGQLDQPWVIVDYAHTPDALERVLSSIATLDPGAVTCVFGCGGDRDRGKRAPMGKAAARYADHIILTDDNPRAEDPAAIVADIALGTAGHPDVRVEHDRERAIRTAISHAGAGDVVLVAGKGHEARQIQGGDTRRFDDRQVVRRALEELS